MDKVFILAQVPRSFREAVKEKAQKEGHTVSLVIRALLAGWLEGEYDPWPKGAKPEKEVEFLEEEKEEDKEEDKW